MGGRGFGLQEASQTLRVAPRRPQDVPGTGPHACRTASRRSRRVPIRPGAAPDGPRTARDGPKGGQRAPRPPPDALLTGPGRPKTAPRRDLGAFLGGYMGSIWPRNRFLQHFSFKFANSLETIIFVLPEGLFTCSTCGKIRVQPDKNRVENGYQDGALEVVTKTELQPLQESADTPEDARRRT